MTPSLVLSGLFWKDALRDRKRDEGPPFLNTVSADKSSHLLLGSDVAGFCQREDERRHCPSSIYRNRSDTFSGRRRRSPAWWKTFLHLNLRKMAAARMSTGTSNRINNSRLSEDQRGQRQNLRAFWGQPDPSLILVWQNRPIFPLNLTRTFTVLAQMS